MPFLTPTSQPVDPAEFLARPRQERIRFLGTFWAEYGFGTPKMVHTIYIVKLLVLYICGGILLATLTSDVGSPFAVDRWWDEPIVYQKLILWTVFLELFGLGGTWGPLAAHFKPMTGGVTYWARPGTIRLPPWPRVLPATSGDNRSVFDVLLYVACLVSLLYAAASGGVQVESLDRSPSRGHRGSGGPGPGRDPRSAAGAVRPARQGPVPGRPRRAVSARARSSSLSSARS